MKISIAGTLRTTAAILGTLAIVESGADLVAGSDTANPILSWGDVGHDTGTSLTVLGRTDYTASNLTIEDTRFTSMVHQKLTADNMTVRNCFFDCSGPDYCLNNIYNDGSNSTDLLIEDCTFVGAMNAALVLGGSGTKTIRRCQFRGQEGDHVKGFGSGVIIFEDCYFGGLSRREGSGESTIHSDLFGWEGSGTVYFIRCTFDTPSIYAEQDKGLSVPIDQPSWLYDRCVSVSVPVANRYYRATQGIFANDGSSGTIYIQDCHFIRPASKCCHFGDGSGNLCTMRLRGNRFYPAWTYLVLSGSDEGTYVDEGDNLWAESGITVASASHLAETVTAGTSIFA